MKLTKTQKNKLFRLFANEMKNSYSACYYCKLNNKRLEQKCIDCEWLNNLELNEKELNAPYWGDVENILQNH